jgi:hypothetical protein
MSQIVAAEKITLDELERYFSLQLFPQAQFFWEWQENLSELTDREKEQLDRIKSHYMHLSKRPMLEEMVKMVVVSPLLDMAGFYEPPFYAIAEKPIKISLKDESLTIRGKIDILVLQNQFWVLAIESKQAGVSLQPAIPQALAYMLAGQDSNQDSVRSLYGLVTNGSNFMFLKLDNFHYALSDEFTLMKKENELYQVLQVLKQLVKSLGDKEFS